MCFSSGSSQTATPAAAPAAPEPAATAADVGAARKAEDTQTFGSTTPTMRVDRTIPGAVAGGSGLTM